MIIQNYCRGREEYRSDCGKKNLSDLMSIGYRDKRRRAKYYCVTWKNHGSHLKIEKFKKKSCLGGANKFS